MSTTKINKYNWGITGDEGRWPEDSFGQKKNFFFKGKMFQIKNNNKKKSTLMKNSYPHKNNLQGPS